MNPFEIRKNGALGNVDYSYLEPTMHKAKRQGNEFSADSLPPLKPEFCASTVSADFSRTYLRSRSLLFALFKSIGSPLYGIAFISICLLFTYAGEPTLIKTLISCFEEQKDEDTVRGIVLCVGIAGLVFLRCMMYNVMYLLQNIAAAKTATALSACVLEKALRLSATEYDRQGQGKILYLQNKAKRISRFMPSLQSLVVDPIKLVITLVMFAREVGYGILLVALAGAVSLCLNVRINRKLQSLNEERDKHGRQGMKHISEYIKGIKAIKLNAWEEYAKDRIGDAYTKEKNCEIRISLWWQLNETQKEALSQTIVIAAIFIAFWMEGNLSASKAYMLLVLYQQLRFPLFSLAGLFSRYSEAKLSLQLIEEFLLLEEKDSLASGPRETGGSVAEPAGGEMVMNQVTASCYEVNQQTSGGKGKETRTILSRLNFRTRRGELVGIVGPVGSGKSLLFRCILGEIKINEGSVHCKGKVVYLPQEPWIYSDTLRANIVMDQPYDAQKYGHILAVCELKNDIELLPEKDGTIIGSRGVNLSGGQRQRVALARALYNDGDIYIFDDCLCQLDSQAATKVFYNVLHNYLQSKTRLFVTGNPKRLTDFKRILVIENGTVVNEGSYNELLSVPAFAALAREQSPQKKGARELNNQQHDKPNVTAQSPKSLTKVVATITNSSTEIRSFHWEDLRPFFHKGNWPYVLLFVFLVLFTVAGDGLRDRWLFIWSCNCYSWDFYTYLLVYLTFLAAGMTSAIIKQYVQKVYEKRFMQQMNSFVMDKTLGAPLWWHDVTSSGKIIRCVTSNFDQIFFVFTQVGNIAQNLGLFLIGVYHIMSEIPEFMVSLCALVTLIIYLRRTSGALVTSSMRFEESGEESLNTSLQELLDGLYIIRANNGGYVGWARSKMYKIIDDQARAQLVRNLSTLWMDLRWKILTTLVFATVVFSCCARQKLMVTSAIGFTVQYTLKMCWTLELLCMNYEELSTYVTSYSRLQSFVESVPGEKVAAVREVDKSWPAKGKIRVRNLSLKYQEQLPYVIRDASFSINHGDKVAIIGRSGTGKSTLLLGLLRIIEPSNGGGKAVIEIDGKNIEEVQLRELRSNVVMVPQEPWVLSGTIRNNIDPFRKESNDLIMKVLQQLGLTELLEKKLKDDSKTSSVLDIEVSENGSNLSQGEKQLLCMARALIKRPKILLLDEATANLDEATESRILSTITEQLKESTIVMISHKENTLEVCNRILMVKDNVCEEIQEREAASSLLLRK